MTAALHVSRPSDRELQVTRIFEAPRTLVFDCWTTPALVQQWLSGPPGWAFETCTIDLVPGGRYRFAWKDDNGNALGLTGTFVEIARPGLLVSTEIFDQDWTGGETRVSIALAETSGNDTTLTQTILYSSMAARDAAATSGMTQGMEMGFNRLAEFLATQPR